MSRRVLVVCLGNICRSPLAEGIFRHRLDQARPGHRVEFDSAGTGHWHAGQPPDTRAIAVAAGHGVDISGLRARQVTVEDFERFDLILAADRSNLADLRRLSPPQARARLALLLEEYGDGGEVPDPYQHDRDAFERVFAMLDAAARRLLDRQPDPV